jgi:hypothetical protein
VGVKDDGLYDWDTDDGYIIDPYAVGAPAEGGSDPVSGGGCDAGAAILPAMAAMTAAFILARKRRM